MHFHCLASCFSIKNLITFNSLAVTRQPCFLFPCWLVSFTVVLHARCSTTHRYGTNFIAFLNTSCAHICTNASLVSDCRHQDYLPHHTWQFEVASYISCLGMNKGPNVYNIYGQDWKPFWSTTYGFMSHIPVQCTTEHKRVAPLDKISTLHNCSDPSQTGPKPQVSHFCTTSNQNRAEVSRGYSSLLLYWSKVTIVILWQEERQQ